MRDRSILFVITALVATVVNAACSNAGPAQRQSAATLAAELISANPVTPVPGEPVRPAATKAPSTPFAASPAPPSVALKKYAWLLVENRQTFQGENNPFWLSFAPEGLKVAAGTFDFDDSVTFNAWDIATGQTLQSFDTRVQSGSYLVGDVSPDWKLMAVGTSEADIVLWDLVTGRELQTLKGSGGPIQKLVFSDSGDRLAASTLNDRVVIWDLPTGKKVVSLSLKGITTIALSPDFDQVLVEAGPHLRLWDTATQQQIQAFDTASVTGFYSEPEFSPDGTLVAVSMSNKEYGHAVQIWDVATGQIRQTLSELSDIVSDTTFSPDGSLLAGISFDGTIQIWEVASGTRLQILNGQADGGRRIAFAPDGSRLATATSDGGITIWGVNEQED